MRLDDTDRLEAFSDGVLAVIITIMAFSIPTPDGSSPAALRTLVPHLLVYVLSFVMVGIYWVNHHHLLRSTEHSSGSVMWANLFLLFWLSLMPIVTAWVGRFPRQYLPAVMYGVVAFGAAIAYSVLVRAIVRTDGPDSVVARGIGSDVKGMASLGLYVAGVVLGLVTRAPWLSYVAYAVVAVIWFIPDRRLTRAVAPSADGTSD